MQQRDTQPEQPVEKKKFRPTKRFIAGSLTLIILVVAIVTAAFLLADSDRRPNYGLYVKDGALYYTDFKNPPRRISSNLTASDGSLPDVDYDLRYCATLSDDGHYLFFPENMTISGEDVQTFDLCYQNLGKKDQPKILISKNVTEYHISSDAMTITYLTPDGLYQYEQKPAQSNLMCSNVYQMYVSDNSSRLVYLTGNRELFAQTVGSKKVKIDNMVDEVLFVAEDYKSVIYRQENSIHKWVSGKGETEICADAINWTIYPTGEALLLSNAEGYSDLYYFDGQTPECIVEHVEQVLYTANEAPVILLTGPLPDEAEQPATGTMLISKNTIYTLEGLEHKVCVGMNASGKQAYFVDQDVEFGNLYVLETGTFGPDELKVYDTDVYCGNITVTDDNRVLYYKEVKDGLGTLYLNSAPLSPQVPLQTNHFQAFDQLPEGKLLYYFTGYDQQTYSGVLHAASTDGSHRQISGAAFAPFMLHNGQILFMEDYSIENGGDLYAYIGGNTILIDTGVTFYIPVI